MNIRRASITALAIIAAVLAGWLAWRRMSALNVSSNNSSASPLARSLYKGGAEEAIRAGEPALDSELQAAAQNAWCTIEQSKFLRAALIERARFTLEPSFEAWQAVATSWGVALPKDPVHDELEVTAEMFKQASAMLAGAQYDFAKGTLRALSRPGQPPIDPRSLGSFAKALYRTPFPRPADPAKATIIEWVVPAKITEAGGKVANVNVGFSFWWQASDAAPPGRWVPHDVTIYLPPGPASLKGHVL